MNGWFNPDNWLDLVSQILLILGAIGIAVVPSVIAARSHKSIARVEQSVSNGHTGVPMRADLDRAIAAIEALAQDVRNLRHDISEEQSLRREVIAELRDDFNRKLGRRAG
jgi:hypothetical protein